MQKAKIGILCWEAAQVPRGLVQLESLVGNSTNPDSYSFPVRFCQVKGANMKTILENPSREVLQTMITEAKAMVADGIRAITTSCGFNAIFQNELAEAVNVPVFTSSLLQVPLVQKMVGPKGEVIILTANKSALKLEHLKAVEIINITNLHICGLETCHEWNKIFSSPSEDIDLNGIREEVVGTALETYKAHPQTRAFVLECTDLPPFSEEIRNKTGLPVFDFITLVNYVYAAICY